MHAVTRTLLFTIGLGIVGSGTLLAQHGGAFGARTPLPSSTAIGAGALSFGPSSTSRASAPSFATPGFGPGYGNVLHPGGPSFPANRGYVNNGGYVNNQRYVHNDLRRPYRALPYAYVAAPFYYPFFDWGGDYSNQTAAPPPAPEDLNNYGPDPATEAMLRNQAALGEQVQRLTDQMNNLMSGPQAAQPPQEPAPPPIPLTVVLRDGQHLTVQNYAITGNTLWDFTGNGAARKIPVANIDVAASSKATEANGGEFPSLGATK